MKKCLIAIAMVLTLGQTAVATAQNHRHTPRTEQADPTKSSDAVEAFSDTTNVAADDSTDIVGYRRSVSISDEDARRVVKSALSEAFGELDGDAIAGMLFVLFILLIIFVLAPIGIIIALFYFINRNRREKYKLAQMAMQNGQPIPDQLLKDGHSATTTKDEYATGMRQLFLGIGLMVFLGYTAGKVGFAIGALVFFIGLGKVVIAKTSRNSIGSEPNGNMSDFNDNEFNG